MAEPVIVITGATASGKTTLAVAVARAIAGEVVSMDSRQVYRGMDIGTAKPDLAERGGVPHHGFDLVDPDQRYSAGAFARDAERWIGAIAGRGRVPILAGGTGFFLRALMQPLFDEPPMDPHRRERLKRWLGDLEVDELARWAAALDPAALGRGGGRQRLARALEVALLSGRPLGWWHAHAAYPPAPIRPIIFVLERPRPELYDRIDRRVADMLDAGLVGEVRALLRRGFDARAPGMSATGYSELIPYLHAETPLAAAAAAIRAATRRYARRQLTWMRQQLPAEAIRLDATRDTDELAARIGDTWRAVVGN